MSGTVALSTIVKLKVMCIAVVFKVVIFAGSCSRVHVVLFADVYKKN